MIKLRGKVIPITADIAARCGELRGQFRQRGITRTQADLLIAATAFQHGLTLATRNLPDFKDTGVRLFNPFTDELIEV